MAAQRSAFHARAYDSPRKSVVDCLFGSKIPYRFCFINIPTFGKVFDLYLFRHSLSGGNWIRNPQRAQSLLLHITTMPCWFCSPPMVSAEIRTGNQQRFINLESLHSTPEVMCAISSAWSVPR